MRIIGATLLLGLLLAADDKDTDEAKLQGSWVVISAELDGKSLDDMKGCKFVFDGKKMKLVLREVREKEKVAPDLPFTLDPTKSPRTIDIERIVGKKKEYEHGIYEVNGEYLTLCVGPMKVEATGVDAGERVQKLSKRPTEFSSKGSVLVKCSREKK